MKNNDQPTVDGEFPGVSTPPCGAGSSSDARPEDAVADPDLDVFVEGLAEAPEILEARHMAESLGRVRGDCAVPQNGHGTPSPTSSAMEARGSNCPSDNEIALLWHETARLQRQFAAAERHRTAAGRDPAVSAVEPPVAFPATPATVGRRRQRQRVRRRVRNGLQRVAWGVLAALISLGIIGAGALGVFDPVRGWLHQQLGWVAPVIGNHPATDERSPPPGPALTPHADFDQAR